MKKILTIILLLLPVTLLAQDKAVHNTQSNTTETTTQQHPKSHIEMFSESGSLIKKEYILVDEVDALRFEVLKITDVTTQKIVMGLRITPILGSNIGVAFLDSDEIDGFLKSVDYMITSVVSEKAPANSVEYNFTSRSGFEFSTYNSQGFFGGKKKWSVSTTLEPFILNSHISLSVEDLQQIKGAIQHTEAKIESFN